MLGYRPASSMYKRMSSRDYANTINVEESAVLIQNGTGDTATNPPWRLSLPHVLVACISSFLFGYHLGVVNEPLESISSDLGFSGNTLSEGMVVSTCLGGAFLGSMFSGWIADGIGRRGAFQLCALPMIVGASISATAESLEGMLVGRFSVGLGMGLGPPVAALYVAEVSPAFVRGTYGSFIQIATCFGLMGALLVGIPVKEITGWWRVCFWLSTIPPFVLGLAMIFCVESPSWLYKQGRSAEAEAELERLMGGSHVKSAIAELYKSDRGENMDSVSISELVHGRHVKVVFLGSTLFALQQLSGINAVFYFSSTVFKSAGVPSDLANIFVGLSNLLGSLVAMALMDKLGRKVLLLWSFFGMVVVVVHWSIFFAPFLFNSDYHIACFYEIANTLCTSGDMKRAVSMALQATAASSYISSSLALYLSVGGMLMFVLAFATGAGPVPSLLLPEIFPDRIRAKAMAVCMCVHWVINFFVGLLFLQLLDQLGPQLLYTVFASFCIMAVAFVKRNVIETKGRSLQEIEIALLPQ